MKKLSVKKSLNFLGNRLMEGLFISQPAATAFPVQDQISLLNTIKRNKKSNKQLETFLDLFVNSKIIPLKNVGENLEHLENLTGTKKRKNSLISNSLFESIYPKNLLKSETATLSTRTQVTEAVLDVIYLKAGFEEVKHYSRRQWREIILALLKKFGWAFILLLLALLMMLNRKKVTLFFLQRFPNLINFVDNLLKKLKINFNPLINTIPVDKVPIPVNELPIPGDELPIPGDELPIPGDELPIPGDELPIPENELQNPVNQVEGIKDDNHDYLEI